MLKFKKYEAKSGDLTSIGSLNENIGEGGTYRIATKKNFLDKKKLVAIVAEQPDGDSTLVLCSKAVSKQLRKKQISMTELGALPIFEVELENDKGEMEMVPFISPNGGGDTAATKVTVSKASKKAKPREVVTDWNELIVQ